MYTLLICADLFGEKVNLELTFPTMPTLGELQRKIIDGFNAECNLRRPQGYPVIEFTIARLQIYDDVMLKWSDLVAVTQLHEYDQLYAFQPQSPWHIDVQKDLPPPRPPAQATPGSTRAAPLPSTPQAGTQYYTSDNQHHSIPPSATAPGIGHYTNGAPPISTGSVRGFNGSPQTTVRLDEQRRREAQLQAELIRMKEETARLEAQTLAEAEEERRREAEAAERYLRAKQDEYQRQRESLLRTEDEIRRLDEELRIRQQGSAPRTLYR